MKRITMILAALMLVAIVAPSFAAVENVRVGGDITIQGIYRNNFDFTKKGNAAGDNGDGNSYYFTAARAFISAELSNKVSAMIRFIDERDWSGTVGQDVAGRIVMTDLAYIKVGDLLIPNLNMTVGRQEIQMGDGLVVGSQYRAGILNRIVALSYYYDMGMQKAFDALRFDYSFAAVPVNLTVFKAKITEAYDNGLVIDVNDSDLMGLDLVWKCEKFSLNPYYVNLSNAGGVLNYGTQEADTLSTYGLRATVNPIEALALSAEYAKQAGENKIGAGFDYEGWAFTFGAEFKFASAMMPVLSFGYNDFSGAKVTDVDAKNWVPVFPSNIASRVGKIAYAAIFPGGEGAFGFGPASGVKVFKLGFGIQPVEKIALSLNWFNLKANEKPAGFKDSVGNEIDLGINYAYSEDLSFGLDLGYFMQGDYIEDVVGSAFDEHAWQAVASMKVAF